MFANLVTASPYRGLVTRRYVPPLT
jgi:hypothetical protein